MQINICLAADKNYLQHLIVTMASVLIHAERNDQINFLVLTDGSISESDLSGILYLGTCEIEIIRADLLIHKYMTVNVDARWSEAVYYRLILPYICETHSKVLYLDCDIVVMSSLSDLWAMPFKEAIAGVIDVGVDHCARLAKEGINLSGNYFNAGVTLWNLDRIRGNDYSELLNEVSVRLPKPEYNDQDWMNLMFEHDKKILDPEWNAMSHMFSLEPDHMIPYSASEISEAISSPRICHYTNKKPWTMTYTDHPYWFEYWQCLKKTPFRAKVWQGYLKKILFSNSDGFFCRTVRPLVKTLLGKR